MTELDLTPAESIWHPMTAPGWRDDFPTLVVAEGDGMYVSDIDGKRYLDAQGGLWCVNVGHNNAEVKAAIVDQLDRLAYYNSFGDTTNPPSIELTGQLLGLLAPEGMTRVMYGSNGSDAVETALKLARHYWKLVGEAGRYKFISLEHAYHGVHFGGTSINGDRPVYGTAYEPLLPGCFQIDSPFLYRNPWTDDPDELGVIVAGILEREILHQGPGTVAAFIAEPVQGAGGVIVPPSNFWPLVREVCDRHGVLLIADEVITGFGRAGSMFGVRAWGVKPDIMCFAKGLSSAYVPISATVVNERVADAWKTPGPEGMIMHGYTYSGHPLASAAAVASLRVTERDGLPENAARTGQHLAERLAPLVDRHPMVGNVRGRGLMWAIDLVTDKATKAPVDPPVAKGVSDIALREGLIVRSIAHKLVISPPLICGVDEADVIVDTIDGALAKASG
jgi:adenosylmethionine-8-amino-7-oxononanoate aminotransferase